MRKFHLFFMILPVLAAFSSCRQKTTKTAKKMAAPIVDVIVADKTNFHSNIEVNGTALSEEMVEFHPEISGRLTYLNIPDGAAVSKGTLLAKINDADLQAQLEQQKVQLDLAVKTEKRLKQLLSVNGVNQSDYDAALSQVNTIQANIKVIEAQIDKTVIRAPFNGKLGLRQVSLGAYVTPQTLIGTLQQSDKIKIDFTVPESFSDFVKIGNEITLQTNLSDEKYKAVISAVEPQIDVNTRNVKVRARLKENKINPGAFVKVLFDKKSEGILVPSNALIPDANSNQVVVVKNKKGVFTNVETGTRNADMVELTSGINPGDTIVVTGVLFVRPNAVVKIRNVKAQQLASNGGTVNSKQ